MPEGADAAPDAKALTFNLAVAGWKVTADRRLQA